MTARQSLHGLVAVSVVVLALGGLVVHRLVDAMGVAAPLGRFLGGMDAMRGVSYYLGGLDDSCALAFDLVGYAALAVGSLVGMQTLRITRCAVRQRTAQTMALPEPLQAAAAAMGIADRLVLSASQDVFSFCFGLSRPRICMSMGLVQALSPGELRAVLAHEHHHLRQHDPLKAFCAIVLAAIAFPVPLAWALRRAYLVACEIDADQAAMAAAGRMDLASALHKVLVHPRTVTLARHVAVGSFGATGERLDRIIGSGRHYPGIDRNAAVWSLGGLGLLVGLAGSLGYSVTDAALHALPPHAPAVCHTVQEG